MFQVLTILNTAAILVAAVFYFRKKPFRHNPCAIRHDLVTINTQPATEGFLMPHTAVLHRCRNCGLHIVVHFPGEWTLEDFRMKDVDLRFLEGIAK